MPWRIEINHDHTEVLLDLRQHQGGDPIGAHAVVQACREKDIPVDSEVQKRIQNVMDNLDKNQSPSGMAVLIKGIPPEPGENAHFEWEEKFDPEKQEEPEEEKTDQVRTSFYDRSNLIIAKKGDVLGRFNPPTNGTSGQDVFGRPITPQPGTDMKFEAGLNIELLPDGQTCVAGCDGEPKLEGGVLSIDPVLTIRGDVDFSTGNVVYSGDVRIKGDVKDLFKVNAGGNVQIDGTIEAAHVECGGSLTVKRGVSGKEKGKISVGKNMSAKYLSNVTVWAEGDVVIESEIVNTDVNSRGKITLERGAITGGQITATGDVEVPILGSPAGVRTIVRAAVDPVLDKEQKELREERAQLSDQIKHFMPQAKALLNLCRGKPNEELNKIAGDIKKWNERVQAIDERLQKVFEQIEENCTGIIKIKKTLYPGVVLYLSDQQQLVDKEMTGPLELAIDKEGEYRVPKFRFPKEDKNKTVENAVS
ncbi:MAG: DUF342 domain-containing protein [Sedimentisphaerales bacterium]|nr:DUF342 domain-containing protein [Sedimentisphaerales bacterium]